MEKNKEAVDEEISIKDGFFYTIAKRAAIDAQTQNTVNIEEEIEVMKLMLITASFMKI